MGFDDLTSMMDRVYRVAMSQRAEQSNSKRLSDALKQPSTEQNIVSYEEFMEATQYPPEK